MELGTMELWNEGGGRSDKIKKSMLDILFWGI